MLCECCHRRNDKGVASVCVCEQVVATALGVNIRGCQNTTVARTRLNPCIFVEVLHVQCCWRALFSDRSRLGAQSALIS